MFNISGQTVINQTNEKIIDISHLENGVYFMKRNSRRFSLH